MINMQIAMHCQQDIVQNVCLNSIYLALHLEQNECPQILMTTFLMAAVHLVKEYEISVDGLRQMALQVRDGMCFINEYVSL